MAAERLSSPPPRDPQQIVEAEQAAYRDELSAPEPDWPPDVRAVYETLHHRLFDVRLEAQNVVKDCGIGSRDIYSRFHFFVGTPIKAYVIGHRLECAKRLLRHDTIPIFRIAYAVGYASASGFSATFKRRVGCTPSAFRKQEDYE